MREITERIVHRAEMATDVLVDAARRARPTLTLPPLAARDLQSAAFAAALDRPVGDETGLALGALSIRLGEAFAECEGHPEASVVVEVRTVGVER